MPELPVWIQFLNGGIGVALVSGVFGVIMATTNRKANEKAEAAKTAGAEITELTEEIKELKETTARLLGANLASLNDRITYLIGVFLERGSVTISEHKNLLLIYEAYRNIGGNGTVTALIEGFKQLPIK